MAALKTFLDEVGARWRPENEELLRDTSRPILIHLRRRLPPEETRHLFAQSPEDIDNFATSSCASSSATGRSSVFRPRSSYEMLAQETRCRASR